MKTRLTAFLKLVAMVGVLVRVPGPVVRAEPTTQPASAPASQPAPLDPAVEVILDRLERKGGQIDDIEAAIRYTKIDKILQDKQRYEGILRFKMDKPNPRFFIRFDKRVHDGNVSTKKEWHVFDGRWYVEARETTKLIVEREIVRPDEKKEVFRLGEGPFPLPFGQKKADIVRHFSVGLAPLGPKDPKGTRHLECTPLPGTELARKYDTVHFYIDPKQDLPVRVRTVDKEEDNEIMVSFASIKLNTGVAASRLNLPDLRGYERRQERLQQPAHPPGKSR